MSNAASAPGSYPSVQPLQATMAPSSLSRRAEKGPRASRVGICDPLALQPVASSAVMAIKAETLQAVVGLMRNTVFSSRLISKLPCITLPQMRPPLALCLSIGAKPGSTWSKSTWPPFPAPGATVATTGSTAPAAAARAPISVNVQILFPSANGISRNVLLRVRIPYTTLRHITQLGSFRPAHMVSLPPGQVTRCRPGAGRSSARCGPGRASRRLCTATRRPSTHLSNVAPTNPSNWVPVHRHTPSWPAGPQHHTAPIRGIPPSAAKS